MRCLPVALLEALSLSSASLALGPACKRCPRCATVMAAPPVDIGTGHEARITPGRAKIDQVPLRKMGAATGSDDIELHQWLLTLDPNDLEIARLALADAEPTEDEVAVPLDSHSASGRDDDLHPGEAGAPREGVPSTEIDACVQGCPHHVTSRLKPGTLFRSETDSSPADKSAQQRNQLEQFLAVRAKVIRSWHDWTPLVRAASVVRARHQLILQPLQSLGQYLKPLLLDLHTRGTIDRRLFGAQDAELSSVIQLLSPDMHLLAKDKNCACACIACRSVSSVAELILRSTLQTSSRHCSSRHRRTSRTSSSRRCGRTSRRFCSMRRVTTRCRRCVNHAAPVDGSPDRSTHRLPRHACPSSNDFYSPSLRPILSSSCGTTQLGRPSRYVLISPSIPSL